MSPASCGGVAARPCGFRHSVGALTSQCEKDSHSPAAWAASAVPCASRMNGRRLPSLPWARSSRPLSGPLPTWQRSSRGPAIELLAGCSPRYRPSPRFPCRPSPPLSLSPVASAFPVARRLAFPVDRRREALSPAGALSPAAAGCPLAPRRGCPLAGRLTPRSLVAAGALSPVVVLSHRRPPVALSRVGSRPAAGLSVAPALAPLLCHHYLCEAAD
jgi:hypothetical protein